MSGWDRVQVIVGSFCSITLIDAYNAFMKAGESSKKNLADGKITNELYKTALKNAVVGIVGLALCFNGWRCRAARTRLDSYQKIQEAIEAAPIKK